MAAIYKKVLPATPNTEQTLHTVGTGYLVLSDLHYTNLDSAPTTIQVRVKSAAGDSDSNVEYYVPPGFGVLGYQYDNLLPRGMKTVYPTGTVFKVASASGQVVFHLTGLEE
jgi:hypothetical protein